MHILLREKEKPNYNVDIISNADSQQNLFNICQFKSQPKWKQNTLVHFSLVYI